MTPTLDTSAYASGDSLGGILTFTNAALAAAITAGYTAYLVSMGYSDKSVQAAPIDCFIFNSTPSAPADQAAYDPADADLLLLASRRPVHITDVTTNNDNCQGSSGRIAIRLNPADGATFFVCPVVRGTPTYGASDLTFVANIEFE